MGQSIIKLFTRKRTFLDLFEYRQYNRVQCVYIPLQNGTLEILSRIVPFTPVSYHRTYCAHMLIATETASVGSPLYYTDFYIVKIPWCVYITCLLGFRPGTQNMDFNCYINYPPPPLPHVDGYLYLGWIAECGVLPKWRAHTLGHRQFCVRPGQTDHPQIRESNIWAQIGESDIWCTHKLIIARVHIWYEKNKT